MSTMEFKEPLSPTPPKSTSRIGSSHSLASTVKTQELSPTLHPQPTPTFGLLRGVGVVVCIGIFFLDSASDIFLAYALWKQADSQRNYYRRKEEQTWFLIALFIIIIPLLVNNIISLIWYTSKKFRFGESSIFYRKSMLKRVVCVALHVLLLGRLARYFEMIHFSETVRSYQVRRNPRRSGSIRNIDVEKESREIFQMQVFSRDTALLDVMHSFLQVSPQILFQIFLIYRNPKFAVASAAGWNLVLTAQVLKVLIGIFCVSWYVVSFQDELLRTILGLKQLSCTATNVCLTWRASMLAARILAIGSFASLKVDGEGGLVKVYSDNAPKGAVLTFPAIAVLAVVGHWVLMIIWVHSQRATFCSKEDGTTRPFLEFLNSLIMAWFHVFSYFNVQNTPSRRRMFFYYALMFIENTGFMVIWYMQIITKPVWMRVIVVFSMEALFFIGLSCAIGYFAFFHPPRLREQQAKLYWQM